MRIALLTIIMLFATSAYSQTPKEKPILVPDADQAKIAALVDDLQKLQAATNLVQARLEAAIVTALARQKLSPDEHEVFTLEGGKYGFRKKQSPATAATPPKADAKTP